MMKDFLKCRKKTPDKSVIVPVIGLLDSGHKVNILNRP